MLLYIVRHGDPDYENDSLTENGRKQADAVAKRLLKSGIDEIYSSPCGRAKETAKPTCDTLDLEMQIMPFMDENKAWYYFHGINEDGKRAGWACDKRGAFLGSDVCYSDPSDFIYGYYEDDRAKEGAGFIKANSDEFLKKLGYEKTGPGNAYKAVNDSKKHVAVFCHWGFGLHWISYLLNLPFHLFTASFDMSHTGVTIISFSPEKGTDTVYPRCSCMSDLSHIYAEGLPMRYNDSFEI